MFFFRLSLSLSFLLVQKPTRFKNSDKLHQNAWQWQWKKHHKIVYSLIVNICFLNKWNCNNAMRNANMSEDGKIMQNMNTAEVEATTNVKLSAKGTNASHMYKLMKDYKWHKCVPNVTQPKQHGTTKKTSHKKRGRKKQNERERERRCVENGISKREWTRSVQKVTRINHLEYWIWCFLSLQYFQDLEVDWARVPGQPRERLIDCIFV